METIRERNIRIYFDISLYVKGIVSLGEVLSGVLILILPPAFLTGWIISASQNELAEEPGDFIATHSLQLAQHFSVASGVIIGVYLLTRGLIKVGLVVALLKNKLWAYPASLLALGLFIIYQFYEIAVGHSWFIVALTVLDLIVVGLIWMEYSIVLRHRANFTDHV